MVSATDGWVVGEGGILRYTAGVTTYRTYARRASQPPTVDGNLSDWGQWSPLVLNRDTARYVATQPPGSPPPTPADNSAELRALWTGANLYLAIFVRDDAIVNDSSDVWRDDEIELAFVGAWDGNPAGGDTHQYTVNADGRITDFGNPAIPVSIQAAAVPVARRLERRGAHPKYQPLRPNAPLTAGKTMAFDLGLHDDDDGGNWDSTMIWAGNSTFNHAGGLLRLEDVVAPMPRPTSTPTSTATPTSTPTRTPTPTADADAHADRFGFAYADRNLDGNGNAHTNADDNAISHADIDANRAHSLPAADLTPLDQRMADGARKDRQPCPGFRALG